MPKFLPTFLIFLLMSFAPVFVSAVPISAQFACVIEAKTGMVIYEKNAYETHSMASTTKIMTALLALEHSRPEEIVTVSRNAAGTEGSSLYLKVGETIKMKDLLYGLMLHSGNDAAVSVAEHVGGDTVNFARMMTERAQKLGARNTAFKNPNGLDEPGHQTTAYDLALITKEALQNPDFAEIVATKKINLPKGENSPARTFVNHNKLLSLYPGCIGVKTGYTKKTGRCLVSAATRENSTFICVTLHAPNDWTDHINLLDYAFSKVKARPLVIKDMIVKTIPVAFGTSKSLELLAAEDFFVTEIEGKEAPHITLRYRLPEEVTAPVTAGTPIGKVTVLCQDDILAEIDLLAGSTIDYFEPPKPGLFENFRKVFANLLNFGKDLCYN